MRIQLWSYNYAPEPMGIGPVSAAWAQAMTSRGHEIRVVAAHPHYPEPQWGTTRWPYHEVRDGIDVTRLPIWIGRNSTRARIRQEASFAAWQTAWLPRLGGTDAVVAVSPCFPALAPAILNRRLRGKPLILWIQDILPDGALSTGLMSEGHAVDAARSLEAAAYRYADHVVVISENFRRNLIGKGVPQEKVTTIYNPSTRSAMARPEQKPNGQVRVLVMGNIGHSQGLDQVVRAFESSPELEQLDARLVITGAGVAEESVRRAIESNRVEFLGLVSGERLDRELAVATIGLVSQRGDFPEFNMPSKLMNYLSAGLPVVASVGVDSEVADVVTQSGAGIVSPSDHIELLGSAIAELAGKRDQLDQMSRLARSYGADHLSPDALATQFEAVVRRVGVDTQSAAPPPG